MAIQSIHPASGELIKEFTPHSDEEVEQKIARSQVAFISWRAQSMEQRAAKMQVAAQLLLHNIEKYARLISLEMGKPIKEARSEIEKCAATCLYYAEHAAIFLKNEPVKTEAQESYVRFDPLGTVLAIMPWNFPFWQVFRFAAPTLMAGNTALLKHASNVPQCALAIEEVFTEAGFEGGVFQSLLIEADRVESLIADERIMAVTITGSEAAGVKVAQAAGRHLKKAVLELGGSDAFIVLDDADIEQAAATAVKARMINTGQSCIAAKRFIVAAELEHKFTDLVQQHLSKLKPGDVLSDETDYGPLARPDLATELDRQVQKSVKSGARLVCGGELNPEKPGFYTPAILTHVEPGMPAFDEELFGPVFSIITANNEEHALELANHSRYGLGASVWSQNVDRAQHFAKKLEAGSVFINALVKSDPRLPFGGIKKSGYGRELSYFGIREFVNQKTVWVA